MAKMEGRILLTERQLKLISKGKIVRLVREGNEITIGVKPSVDAKLAVKAQIAKLRDKLKKM